MKKPIIIYAYCDMGEPSSFRQKIAMHEKIVNYMNELIGCEVGIYNFNVGDRIVFKKEKDLESPCEMHHKYTVTDPNIVMMKIIAQLQKEEKTDNQILVLYYTEVNLIMEQHLLKTGESYKLSYLDNVDETGELIKEYRMQCHCRVINDRRCAKDLFIEHLKFKTYKTADECDQISQSFIDDIQHFINK